MRGESENGPGPSTAEVRSALRALLEARGHVCASDSHGLRDELYIIGERDLARALFEFKATAEEACDTMYQGSWAAGMPPRFAVMPLAEADSPAIEMLEQIRVVPLFYHASEAPVFPDLDRVLSEHLPG